MNFRSIWALLALAVLVAGCQSTSIRSAWFDTDFTGPPMRKIVVVGAIDSVADGRLFEDLFAEQLRAAGVEGVAGHSAIPAAARESDPAFVAAVVNSGAQGLLLVRLLGVETRTHVSTTMTSGGMGWGHGAWGGVSRRRVVPVQQVSQYDVAAVEAKLFDVQTQQLVWAATTSTMNPTSVARETPGFATLVIGELASRGVIPKK